MDAVNGDASKLTLEDITGYRIPLIDNIQQEVRSAIGSLVSEWDILTVKYVTLGCLERVYHGLDLIKASFKEEGIVSCDHELTFIGTNFADQKLSSSLKIALSFFSFNLESKVIEKVPKMTSPIQKSNSTTTSLSYIAFSITWVWP